MECKFCGAENDEEATYCKDCGKRVDGKVVCPKCGVLTENATFCNFCGSPLDGRHKCQRCGTLFEGQYCTECGMPAYVKKSAASRRVKKPEAITETEDGDTAAMEKDLSSWKKVLSITGLIIALAAIVTIFVLTFFTGAEYKVTGYGLNFTGSDLGTEKYNLFHFFGKAYTNIKNAEINGNTAAAAYTISALGTIISAAMIIVMTVMAAISVTKLIKKLLGRPVKHTERYVFLTYFLYVAFVLMFNNLLAVNETYAGIEASIGFNSASMTGLILGGCLAGVYFITRLVVSGKDLVEGGRLGRVIPAAVCSVLLIVSLGLLSSATCGFKGVGSYSDETYRYNYLYFTFIAEPDGYDIYVYSFFAELFSAAFIILASITISDLLSDMAGNERLTYMAGRDIGTFVVCVLLLAFAIVTVNKSWTELELEADEASKNFSTLIAGFVLSAISFATAAVCNYLGAYKKIFERETYDMQ
ncbi:MAG: zinc ribbon domain-containing protein [Clostridia bacterium]|nr:zinc ribbon domain-containing protein [Clostridia bacterium]